MRDATENEPRHYHCQNKVNDNTNNGNAATWFNVPSAVMAFGCSRVKAALIATRTLVCFNLRHARKLTALAGACQVI